MTWLDVPGWLSTEEGNALALLALGKDVLELGSWKGRSTACMAQTAKHVHAVDWFKGDAGAGWEDTFPAFLGNIERCGVMAKVTPVVSRIELGILPGATFDLVFVDDSHDVESVKLSTRLALDHLRPGGTIAWHDWDYHEVRTAVNSLGYDPKNVRDRLAWLTF